MIITGYRKPCRFSIYSAKSIGVDHLPYVKVEIAKGIATVEQKRAVIKGMTDVLVKELGRNPEYIFVVIDEVDTDNWGRKGFSLSELWSQSQPTEP
jgi:4-oxalocrotonate tautomerase